MKLPSIKRISFGVLGLFAVGFGAYWYTQQALEVTIITPTFITAEESIEESGVLKCISQLTLYAKTTGTVEAVYKDVGEAVQPKNLLLKYDDSLTALQLDDAAARINAAKASLEGTSLGVLANKMDLARLAISEGERQVAVLEESYQQTKTLLDSGSASNEDLRMVASALESARNQLKSAEVSYKEIASGVPSYQKKQLQAQLEQALIYRSTLLLEQQKLELFAPITGVILERFVQPEMSVVFGTPLMTIGDPKKLKVLVDVLADDIGTLNVNDPVELAAPYLKDKKLVAHVESIAPVAKESMSSLGVSQKRIEVTVALNQSDPVLKPGMPIEVRLIATQKKDALTIPSVAVFEDASGKGVYVAVEGRVKLIRITTGIESGDVIEVLTGLSDQDQVIIDPITEIKEGIKVSPKPMLKK